MSISVISVKTMLEVLSPDCHTSQRVGSREIVGRVIVTVSCSCQLYKNQGSPGKMKL